MRPLVQPPAAGAVMVVIVFAVFGRPGPQKVVIDRFIADRQPPAPIRLQRQSGFRIYRA